MVHLGNGIGATAADSRSTTSSGLPKVFADLPHGIKNLRFGLLPGDSDSAKDFEESLSLVVFGF